MSINLKEAQKKIQEKDYEGAYNICQELLKNSNNENKSSLNLLIINATCAFQLLNYNEAEKSFKLAITLDTNGQYTQKIWKVISFSSFSF